MSVAGNGFGDAPLLLQRLRLVAQLSGLRLTRLLVSQPFFQLCHERLQLGIRPQNKALLVPANRLGNAALLLLRLRLVAQLLRLRLTCLLVGQALFKLGDEGLKFRVRPYCQALFVPSNGLGNTPLLLQRLRLVPKLPGLNFARLLVSLRPFETRHMRLQALVPLDIQTGCVLLDRQRQIALSLGILAALAKIIGLRHLLAVIGDLPPEPVGGLCAVFPVVEHALEHRNGRPHVLGLLQVGRGLHRRRQRLVVGLLQLV